MTNIKHRKPSARLSWSACGPTLRRPMPAVVGSAVSAQPRSSVFDASILRVLEPILGLTDGYETTDILLQGTAQGNQLWVNGLQGMRQVFQREIIDLDLREFAVELIAAGGGQLDDLHPAIDVGLPGGVRVHAVLDPVASFGVAVSIRLPHIKQLNFDDLKCAGLGSKEAMQMLENGVKQKRNILITGGTGSGKTTLLSALLDTVPVSERIITIEDTRELRLKHQHWIALQTKPANSEGAGEITLEYLLRQTLRMRPDRLVLGECRGGEIATLLSALNTGHDGSFGTLHARSIDDVPARIEALGALAGLSVAAITKQAITAIDMVVHLGRHGNKHKIFGIGELSFDRNGAMKVVRMC